MIELKVEFPHIISYLRNTGWERTLAGELGEFWSNGAADELLVPKFSGASDFNKRLELLTRDLQRFESRSASDIAGDMARQFLDITDVRAEHDYGQDCIPLDAGQKLFTTAKGLVVASAASTLQRRGYFGKSIPKRAREQANKSLVGHTRPGSYIVPIINSARLPDTQPEDEQQLRLIETVEEAAFERRATTTLARALGVLHEITVDRGHSPSTQEIHDAVGEGISVEMCRSIVMSLKNDVVNGIDISIAWAPGVEAPRGVAKHFEFPSESKTAINDVAATLKRDPSNSEEVLYGLVVSLKSRTGDAGGRVEIETLIDGAKRLLRVDLPDSDYEVARARHKRGPVIVRGRLHRNPGRMATMDVTSFEPDLSLPFDVYEQH